MKPHLFHARYYAGKLDFVAGCGSVMLQYKLWGTPVRPWDDRKLHSTFSVIQLPRIDVGFRKDRSDQRGLSCGVYSRERMKTWPRNVLGELKHNMIREYRNQQHPLNAAISKAIIGQ